MAILTADKVAEFFEHGAPVKLDVKLVRLCETTP